VAPCASSCHNHPNRSFRLLLQSLYLLEEMFKRMPTLTRLITSEDPP
jgi:hypothetical protein